MLAVGGEEEEKKSKGEVHRKRMKTIHSWGCYNESGSWWYFHFISQFPGHHFEFTLHFHPLIPQLCSLSARLFFFFTLLLSILLGESRALFAVLDCNSAFFFFTMPFFVLVLKEETKKNRCIDTFFFTYLQSLF